VIESLETSNGKDLWVFGGTALSWLALAQIIVRISSATAEESTLASQWVLGLWFLCVLDLLVLRKLISIILHLVSDAERKSAKSAFQALIWGALKLLCLGLFILVLLKGQKIPMHGLMLGIGTLGTVPVLGGLLWSQRKFQDA
jgi:hypothetical protein